MNDELRLKFLDLKDSAIVISLNPFKPPTRKINERNVSSTELCSNIPKLTSHLDGRPWRHLQGYGEGLLRRERLLEQLRRQVLPPPSRPTAAAVARTGRLDDAFDTEFAFAAITLRDNIRGLCC